MGNIMIQLYHNAASINSQYACVLCGSVGEMVEGKLLPQLKLTVLSASGFRRCLREDHSVGCGEWHSPL